MTQINKQKTPLDLENADSACCQTLFGLLDPTLFRALADENRLSLLCRLASCGRPCTVTELNACCPVDLSVVSRHLAILRDAGALEATKHGKEVHYCVQFDRLIPLMRQIADALESCQCQTQCCTSNTDAKESKS